MISQFSVEGREKKRKIGRMIACFQVPSGKRLIGDSGYAGEAKKISTLGDHSKEVKEYFAGAKSRQETINAEYKNFNISGASFRHKGEKRSGSRENG